MVIDFEDEDFYASIFPHSKETETGGGRERVGQSTIIVSLDGTGDTDSIQEAIDMLPAEGGEVFIKEGTYTITTSKDNINAIKITSNNVHLIGTGHGTKIEDTGDILTRLLQSTGSGTIIENMFFSIVKEDGEGVNLSGNENLITNTKIEASGTATVSTHGLIITGSDNIISNNFLHGISITGTSANKNIINNNTLVGTLNNDKITIWDGADKNIITGNTIANGGVGIYFGKPGVGGTNPKNNIVSNNIITECTNGDATGIWIDSGDKNIILGNISLNNTVNLSDGGTNTELGHNITA